MMINKLLLAILAGIAGFAQAASSTTSSNTALATTTASAPVAVSTRADEFIPQVANLLGVEQEELNSARINVLNRNQEVSTTITKAFERPDLDSESIIRAAFNKCMPLNEKMAKRIKKHRDGIVRRAAMLAAHDKFQLFEEATLRETSEACNAANNELTAFDKNVTNKRNGGFWARVGAIFAGCGLGVLAHCAKLDISNLLPAFIKFAPENVIGAGLTGVGTVVAAFGLANRQLAVNQLKGKDRAVLLAQADEAFAAKNKAISLKLEERDLKKDEIKFAAKLGFLKFSAEHLSKNSH